jgi:hypothetical protein
MTENKAQEIIDRAIRTRRVYDAMVARDLTFSHKNRRSITWQ